MGGGNNLVQTPIRQMYVAGKQDIPAEGDFVSQVANDLYSVLDGLNVESARAGDPTIMTSMLKIGGEIYQMLGDAVTSMDNCANAVIATADDFVKHDARARDDFQHLGKGLKDAPIFTHPAPPPLKNPEAPGATTPDTRQRMGRGDFEPHPDIKVPSTAAPDKPADDQQGRTQTQQQDEKDNPVIHPENSPR